LLAAWIASNNRYSLNHRMKVLSIAAILLAFSPIPGVAQHYSASMDLRNSYTLDGTRRMTEYFLEVQRQHCSSKSARLAGENAAYRQRLAALAPRISSLLHLNRKRTAAKEGDATAKALDARLAKEQTETFTKLSSGYEPRGEVSLKACIAESARMAGMLADFEESVASIEENSRLLISMQS
jgi:hypothetical protein